MIAEESQLGDRQADVAHIPPAQDDAGLRQHVAMKPRCARALSVSDIVRAPGIISNCIEPFDCIPINGAECNPTTTAGTGVGRDPERL